MLQLDFLNYWVRYAEAYRKLWRVAIKCPRVYGSFAVRL